MSNVSSKPHCFKIVDHIDGNEKNNHFLNLRWVSGSESNFNRVIPDQKYLTGIYKRFNRFVVAFGKNKQQSFETY